MRHTLPAGMLPGPHGPVPAPEPAESIEDSIHRYLALIAHDPVLRLPGVRILYSERPAPPEPPSRRGLWEG